MIHLPQKVWDVTRYQKDSGYLFLFKDENDAWHQLQIFTDGRPSLIHHFDVAPDLETFGDFLPPVAIEVYAEDFRIHWFEDGRIGVNRIVTDGKKGR